MTNADKIRAMTDEELAKMLSTTYDCYWCPINCPTGAHGLGECKETILDWLKQEVKDDA